MCTRSLCNSLLHLRYPDYTVFDRPLIPVSIAMPLDVQPLRNLLLVAKQCLGNNFMGSLLTIAGSIIAFHYESILEIQDECPLVLCHSYLSGTGKCLLNGYMFILLLL